MNVNVPTAGRRWPGPSNRTRCRVDVSRTQDAVAGYFGLLTEFHSARGPDRSRVVRDQRVPPPSSGARTLTSSVSNQRCGERVSGPPRSRRSSTTHGSAGAGRSCVVGYDSNLPPLTQTPEEPQSEPARPDVCAWGYRRAGRLVASARVQLDGNAAGVGRTCVVPREQGQGLGRASKPATPRSAGTGWPIW